jgi:hypothetical protein
MSDFSQLFSRGTAGKFVTFFFLCLLSCDQELSSLINFPIRSINAIDICEKGESDIKVLNFIEHVKGTLAPDSNV